MPSQSELFETAQSINTLVVFESLFASLLLQQCEGNENMDAYINCIHATDYINDTVPLFQQDPRNASRIIKQFLPF